MNPVYKTARCETRARAMHSKYGDNPTTSYTDASPYPHKPAPSVQEDTAVTVRTTSTKTAKETAIALAATTGEDTITVLTDSPACRNCLTGRISLTGLKILKTATQLSDILIVWIPGHESLQGNEAAHIHVAITREGHVLPDSPKAEPLLKYADILAHYRHQ